MWLRGGMVDTMDSKSIAARCAGSSPAGATNSKFYLEKVIGKGKMVIRRNMAFYFESLQVWQKAFWITESIYVLLKSFPEEEKFALSSQIRRSAISIVSNIAEGNGRWSDNEYAYFLKIAKWSCSELATQILLAAKFNYIKDENAKDILGTLEEINKMLFSMIQNNQK
jgi:four helix bundle protein